MLILIWSIYQKNLSLCGVHQGGVPLKRLTYTTTLVCCVDSQHVVSLITILLEMERFIILGVTLHRERPNIKERRGRELREVVRGRRGRGKERERGRRRGGRLLTLSMGRVWSLIPMVTSAGQLQEFCLSSLT